MSRQTTLIVRDLKADMHIGVYDSEKGRTQPVVLCIEADVTLPDDWQADDYSKVLGYDKIVAMVRELAAGGHIELVETLAETIAARCLEWPQVDAVRVQVEKPQACADAVVGVRIARQRG